MEYLKWPADNKNLVYRGRQTLQYFHNEMLIRFPDKYKFTFDQLFNYLQLQEKNPADFIFGDEESPLNVLGRVVSDSKITDEQINDGFKALSKKLEGRLPRPSILGSALLSSLSGELGTLNLGVLGDAAIEVVKDTVKKGNEIGTALVDSTQTIIESSKYFIPAALLIVVAVFAYKAKKA